MTFSTRGLLGDCQLKTGISELRIKLTKRVIDQTSPGTKNIFLWDSGLHTFGIKITPSNKRVFILQYRQGRGRSAPVRRYTIGPYGVYTPEQARAKALAILQDVREGKFPQTEEAPPTCVEFHELLDQYCKSRRDKARRSADEIERILRKDVLPTWANRAVETITRHEAVSLIDSVKDRGAPILANRILANLKAMFRWAVNRGLIAISPIDGLEKPATEISRDRVPSKEELVEIWQASLKMTGPFGAAIRILVLTGQRRDEVGEMRWSELDLDRALWTLPASRTKNGQPHIIPLAPMAIEILKLIPRFSNSDFVFSTTGIRPISGWSTAKRQIDRLINVARQEVRQDGIPKKMEAWRIHDLRRAFATGMNDLGILPHVADRILNHVAKKKGGVMAVYNRAEYLNERKEAILIWEDSLRRWLCDDVSSYVAQKVAA